MGENWHGRREVPGLPGQYARLHLKNGSDDEEEALIKNHVCDSQTGLYEPL